MRFIPVLSFIGLTVLVGCGPTERASDAPLFELMAPADTGLDFVNEIQEDAGFNVLEYEYFYNGGGVAVGDVNQDGRPDLFFTANIGPDRLYLNRGEWRFEDVTEQAGFRHAPSWTTGVTMVDINADGWLDIYVCKSGRVGEERRRNALYINNQDGTFSEQAAAYGIDSPAYSTHATFFDYDRDGDLDLYLLNHPIRRLERFDVELVKQQRDPLSGDKLFRNDGGTFVDVSEDAGIIGNPLGFGLSVTTSDIDGDGWLDLYIANDYVEDDYLYINNQDGTFREEIRSWMRYTSNASMGADIADINNDGLQDVVTLDMLAEDPRRLHRLKGPDDDARFQQLRREGYHAQYTRNMLQLNQGNGTFSEIGQLAGIAQTDWSWAPLLADFDNDGYKDLFVTNGYMRDYTDMDFLTTKLRAALQVARNQGQPLDALTLVQQMSMSTLPNYGYRNRGDLTFANVTDDWGLGKPGLSSGAAYADLDDDGDLDLIVTNLNEPAWLYQNTADQRRQHNYLKVDLTGAPGNTLGIGTHVSVALGDGSVLVQEQMSVRGYQSSVDPVLLFGLGKAAEGHVTVTWPDGRHETRDAVAANQTLAFDWSDASDAPQPPTPEPTPRFVLLPDGLGLDAVHRENEFDDLEREPLLPRRFSRQGPALAVADINRDGLDDVFVGGAQDQGAQLYLQQVDATFKPAAVPAFATDAAFEDVDALFFDAENDGDLDLYVVSGGSARTDGAAYQDRLYLNSGFGGFTRAPDALPNLPTSSAVVTGHDWDGDGDTDLFVGGHVQPGSYPLPERSYLLENTGGTFTDATERLAPELMAPGLVGDALWADLDGDGSAELVVTGEWMPIRVFQPTDGGSFAEVTSAFGFDGTSGWWRSLLAHDLDGDGDLDLLAGNRGLNTQMPAPATIYAADFDANGQMESVMSYTWDGVAYPVPNRDELLRAIPFLGNRFPTYASYAIATSDSLLPAAIWNDALVLDAQTFATTVFENNGDATFTARLLPSEVQLTPVFASLALDADRDGTTDLLLAGNDSSVRAQWGREQAGQGLWLRGRDALGFTPTSSPESGLFLPGDVREMQLVRTPSGTVVVAATNDSALQVFGIR